MITFIKKIFTVRRIIALVFMGLFTVFYFVAPFFKETVAGSFWGMIKVDFILIGTSVVISFCVKVIKDKKVDGLQFIALFWYIFLFEFKLFWWLEISFDSVWTNVLSFILAYFVTVLFQLLPLGAIAVILFLPHEKSKPRDKCWNCEYLDANDHQSVEDVYEYAFKCRCKNRYVFTKNENNCEDFRRRR